MSIVKWFVQKIKQLIQSRSDKEFRKEVRKWNSVAAEKYLRDHPSSVVDESQYEEWLEKNRLIERINDEERLKSLSKQDILDEAWAKRYPRRIEPICNDCGFYVSGCLCGWRKSDQES